MNLRIHVFPAVVLSCCALCSYAADNAIVSAMPWTIRNYEGRLSFETNSLSGADPFIVIHGATTKCDTAWSAVTKKLTIPAVSSEFLLSFEARSPRLVIDP